MAFCKNIGRTIYKAMGSINDEILNDADKVLAITKKIKELNDDPTIEAIEAALGIGSPVHAWIDKALDVAYKLEGIGKTLAQKFKELLDKQPTQIAKEGVLVKVAAVATNIGSGDKLPDHIADQAVTVAIARTKVPD